MSKVTEQRLIRLAERISDQSRKVAAMQLEAQLLEDAVARIEE